MAAHAAGCYDVAEDCGGEVEELECGGFVGLSVRWVVELGVDGGVWRLRGISRWLDRPTTGP